MLLHEAKNLFEKAENENWINVFDLLKIQSNSKIRMLACNLIVNHKCFEKLSFFLDDKDGHVRKYSRLYYYKRALISKISEKITYDFIPYSKEFKYIEVGEYPYTLTYGYTDFEYFFAKSIKLAYPLENPFHPNKHDSFDYTSSNYIPKDKWSEILKLSYSSTEFYNEEYKKFVLEMCLWIESKLVLAEGIKIYGNM